MTFSCYPLFFLKISSSRRSLVLSILLPPAKEDFHHQIEVHCFLYSLNMCYIYTEIYIWFKIQEGGFVMNTMGDGIFL